MERSTEIRDFILACLAFGTFVFLMMPLVARAIDIHFDGYAQPVCFYYDLCGGDRP